MELQQLFVGFNFSFHHIKSQTPLSLLFQIFDEVCGLTDLSWVMHGRMGQSEGVVASSLFTYFIIADQPKLRSMLALLLNAIIITACTAFQFEPVQVTPISLVILQPTQYTIFMNRRFLNAIETNWSTSPVPQNSLIVVKFPNDYTLTGTETCDSLQINSNSPISNCTITISNSNKTITISNAIPNSIAISSVTVVFKNVVNPYPAVTTSPFICTIGVDTSLSDLFATVTLQPAPFTACQITFANQSVNTTSNMIVNLTNTNQITSNGQIRIKFPSTLRWAREAYSAHLLPLSSVSCSSLTSAVNTGVICLGDNSGQTITLSNLSSSTIAKNSSISISIAGLFSPPTTESVDILTISSMFANGSLIDSSDCFITNLKAKSITSFNSTVASKKTINTNVTLTFTFITVDTITYEDYLQFHFPIGTRITTSSIASSPLRLNTPPTFYSATAILNVTQQTTSLTQLNNTSIRVTFSFYLTPPSVKPTQDIVIKVMKAGYSKMEGKVKFVADPNTYDFNVSLNTTATAVPVECKLNFTMLDSITSTGYIVLNIPSQFTIGSLTVEVQSNSSQTSTTPTLTMLTQTSYQLSSLSSSSLPPQTLTLILRHLSTPAYAQNISNFSMSIYYSSQNYLTANGNQLNLVEIPAGKITNAVASVSANRTSTSGELSISFTLQNGIEVNGSIVITIPKQIQTTSPSCILSNAISNTTVPQTCSYNSVTNQITLTLSAQVSTAQDLSVEISSIKTPNSTAPTQTFNIITYDSGQHIIDTLSGMVTLRVEQPNRLSVVTNRESSTNSGQGWWQIQVDLEQDIDTSQSNQVWLSFAPDITIESNLTAMVNSNPTTLTISSTSPLSLIVDIPATATSSFSLNLSSLVNSASLQELSSPYTIVVGYELANATYYYSEGVAANIKNLVPSQFGGLDYVFGNAILFDTTTLVLDINLTSHQQVFSIELQLTSTLAFPSAVTCSSPTPVTCTTNSSILTIASSQPLPENIHIQISPISTPTTYLATYAPSVLTSYNLNGYVISNNSDIQFIGKCIKNCWKCENNGFDCLECYKQQHQVNDEEYLQGTTCVQTCFDGWYAEGFECMPCGGNCLECVNTSTTCTACSNSTYLHESDCIQTCPNTTYPSPPSNQTLTCVPCPSPCDTCQITPLSLICTSCSVPLYLHNDNCISTCPASTTVPNPANQSCDACSQQCLTCQNTTDTCTSCNSSYVLINSSCLNECGDAKIVVNGSCVDCLPQCSKCHIDIDNCLECKSGYFLHNNTCNDSCPPHYYENNTSRVCGYCGNLPLNCVDCDSTGLKCLSCEAPFIFFNQQCVLQLPDGYYNDSGEGKKCENQCKTCNISSDHCLTCIDGLFLQGTDCVANCSNGSTPIGNNCLPCVPPCSECSSSTSTCTACQPPNYLYGPNSTCIPLCPNTTFPSNTTQACESCPSPCKTCLIDQTCTSCEDNYYLNSNGECVDICGDGWVGVNGTCLECQAPCSECTGDVTNCTACLGQFYAYEGQCVGDCPEQVTIPDDDNMICLDCAPPCQTCVNLTTTCTSCRDGTNLYNNQCLQTCPNTTYPQAKACLPCQEPCLTCTSPTVCTSCLAPLLMFETSCVDTCPSTHAIIRQSKCVACSPTIPNCITCTSSPKCLSCQTEFILFEGACYTDCPTGYVYDTQKDTCITVDQNADEDLDNVLASSSIFPMPFTIIWISIFVAMIMSKLQNKNTYLVGAAYCTSGILQTGALIFLTIKFYIFAHSLSLVSATESAQGQVSGVKQIPLLAIGLIIIYAINIIGLAVQTPLLYWDKQFQVWLKSHCFHRFFFAITSVLSVLISYKLKLILFCKLFSFSCTRGQLESVQKFRMFNLLSFLGVGHEVFVIYVSVVLILRFKTQIMNNEIFLIFIDTIAVTCLGIIFSIIASKKDDDFFVEQAENGYKLNKKVVAEGDDYGKQGLEPKFLKGEQNKIQQMDSFQKMFLDEQDEDDEYEDEEISLSISQNRSEVDKKERMRRNLQKNLAAGNIERNKSQIYTSKTVKKLGQDRQDSSNPINRDLFKDSQQMNSMSHNVLAGKESERQYKEDELKDKSLGNTGPERQLNANEILKNIIQKTDRSESKGTYADKMQVIFDGDESEESEKDKQKQNDGQIQNKIAQKMKQLEELKLQANQNTAEIKENIEDKAFQMQERNQMLFQEEDTLEHNEDEFIKENSTLIQLQKQQRQQRRLYEEKQHQKIDEEFEFMGDMAESKAKMEVKENNFMGAQSKIIEECENLQEGAHHDQGIDKSKTLEQQNNQEHNELHDDPKNLESQNEEMISNENINLDDQSEHRQNDDNYFDDFLEEKQQPQQNSTTPRQLMLREGQKESLEQIEAISSTDQNQAKLTNDAKQQPQQKSMQNPKKKNVNTEEAIQEKVQEEKANKKKDKYKGILDFEDQGEVQGSGLDDSSPEFDQQINNNPLRSSFASQNRSIQLPRRQQSGHPLVNLLQVSSSKNQTQTETRRDDNARTTLTQYFGHSETKTTRPNNQRPPLQRPSSQERGRLYAAGVRQMETNKRNSRQKSRKKSEQSEQPQPMISLDHKKKNKSLYSVPMNKISRKDSRQVSDLTDQFIQPQGYFAPSSSEDIHGSNLNYSSTMNIETNNEPDKPRLIGLTSRPNYKGVSTSQQRNRKKRENPSSGGSQMFTKKSIANSQQEDDEDELNEFYGRKLTKSRSKQKNMSRESLERMKQLQKVYLQRLDGGKKH